MWHAQMYYVQIMLSNHWMLLDRDFKTIFLNYYHNKKIGVIPNYLFLSEPLIPFSITLQTDLYRTNTIIAVQKVHKHWVLDRPFFNLTYICKVWQKETGIYSVFDTKCNVKKMKFCKLRWQTSINNQPFHGKRIHLTKLCCDNFALYPLTLPLGEETFTFHQIHLAWEGKV